MSDPKDDWGEAEMRVCRDVYMNALVVVRERTHDEARRPSCDQEQSAEFLKGWTAAMEQTSLRVAALMLKPTRLWCRHCHVPGHDTAGPHCFFSR